MNQTPLTPGGGGRKGGVRVFGLLPLALRSMGRSRVALDEDTRIARIGLATARANASAASVAISTVEKPRATRMLPTSAPWTSPRRHTIAKKAPRVGALLAAPRNAEGNERAAPRRAFARRAVARRAFARETHRLGVRRAGESSGFAGILAAAMSFRCAPGDSALRRRAPCAARWGRCSWLARGGGRWCASRCASSASEALGKRPQAIVVPCEPLRVVGDKLAIEPLVARASRCRRQWGWARRER